MVVKTPAKINLFLKVLGRRPDGYHELDSLMAPVEVFDHLRLEFPRAHGLSLVCPGHPELEGPDNLALRAADAFFRATGRAPRLRLHLRKNIPLAAGLGGGSSDAGATLRALNRHFGHPLAPRRIANLALRLGADVPFFLRGGPCRAGGVGERLRPVRLPPFWVVLAFAPFGLSTREVFERFDRRSRSGKGKKGKNRLTERRDSARERPSGGGWSCERLAENLVNDLQPIGEALHPEIGRVRLELLRAGAAGASMSGSGPTVFGLFFDGAAAARSLRALRREGGWTYLVARGVAREPADETAT
jgi:4-diphosphocytidyl-2-C-methyl-D-erythritol kinase